MGRPKQVCRVAILEYFLSTRPLESTEGVRKVKGYGFSADCVSRFSETAKLGYLLQGNRRVPDCQKSLHYIMIAVHYPP